MSKLIILPILWAAMFSGCRSAEQSAPEGREITRYYNAASIPPDVYRTVKTETITITDNLFTDVNAEIDREINRRAARAHADAVLIGDISRSRCTCAACRKYEKGNDGPHVVVAITLLQKQTP